MLGCSFTIEHKTNKFLSFWHEIMQDENSNVNFKKKKKNPM